MSKEKSDAPEAEAIEPGKGFSRGKILAATESRQFGRNFGNGVIIDDGPPKEKRRPGKDGASELVVGSDLSTLTSAALQALGAQIKVEFEAVRRHSIKAAEHTVKLGELLDQARASLPHGGWLKWIEANCGLGKSSIYNFMAISGAVQRGEIDLPTVGTLGLKAALKVIAKPRSAPAVADPADATGRAAVIASGTNDRGCEAHLPARYPAAIPGKLASALVADLEQLVGTHMKPCAEKAAALRKIKDLRDIVAAFERAMRPGAE